MVLGYSTGWKCNGVVHKVEGAVKVDEQNSKQCKKIEANVQFHFRRGEEFMQQ